MADQPTPSGLSAERLKHIAGYENDPDNHEKSDVLRQLGEAEGSDIASLPERHFRDLFVPVFATGKNEKFPMATIDVWYRVAGGGHKPVRIIADTLDEKGEEILLFEVPPLFNAFAIRPITHREEQPLFSFFDTYRQIAAASPQDAKNFMSAALTKRMLTMRVPGSLGTALKFWSDIFVRYGYPAIQIPSETLAELDESTPTNATPSADEDLEML